MVRLEFPSNYMIFRFPVLHSRFKQLKMPHAFYWIFEKKRWSWAYRLGNATMKVFTSHPAQTQETYLQHLWFTVKTSLRFLLLAVLLFLHGVFPFLFTRTASAQIESIYRLMRSRIPPARRDAINAEYEI